MKTFLKVLLLVVLALLAFRFLPMFLAGSIAGLLVAAVLGAIGIPLMAVLLMVAFGLVLALSPIWIPVLVLMGVASLFRRAGDKPTAQVVAA